jgi:KDO2-lipid IV(A) lauroyltransferase
MYGPESKSPLHQWHRRVQTRLGNAVVLWMARRWQRMPAARGERLGAAIGTLMRMLSPRHARIVITNLRLAFGGEKSEEELREIARACYRHLGRCMMEFIRLPAMTVEDIKELAELRGGEHLRAALEKGQGAILLTGHLGNWEIAGSRVAAEGYPLSVIARAQRDNEITEYVRRTRETMGMRVLHREVAVRSALRALRDNEVLGILLDQNAGDEGIFVDFFGCLASTAPGAAAFTLRTGAVVLPTFGWRNPDGRHTVMISEPVPLIETGNRDNDLLENTARYTKIIEQQIRAHPEQWFWLHKRWKARPPEEQGVTARTSQSSGR